MEYAFILLSILYLFYYLIYKYIIEMGTSYIYWHLWHTALCATTTILFDIHPKLVSYILGNCIISLLLLAFVIIMHEDVIEIIKERMRK